MNAVAAVRSRSSSPRWATLPAPLRAVSHGEPVRFDGPHR